jgi:hypothetical protein
MKIAISDFVRRQTEKSQFSHWTLFDDELIALVESNFSKAKKGYRDGVCLVPVPPKGFYSSVVKLEPGDKLAGVYEARKEGETPRKSVFSVKRNKLPAVSVDIVLYSHETLAENNEQSCDADWEIISINASPTEDEMPIPTGALIANHLKLSGGTDTKMSDSDFVALLRKSVEFWSDKALCSPDEVQ